MRININLASQPYEDVRRFLVQWGALVLLLAVVTLALVYAAVSAWLGGQESRRQIAEIRSELKQLEQKTRAAEAVLNRSENRQTRERARFLNALIARKAFSWTQVFADLEEMMPPRVHVLSVRPQLTADNELEISMQVAGASRERALDLLRRMEQSESFRRPEVRSEQAQRGGEGLQLEIVALYVPRAPQPGAD